MAHFGALPSSLSRTLAPGDTSMYQLTDVNVHRIIRRSAFRREPDIDLLARSSEIL